MPQSYRFEISPNNRAGCQNKLCKDAGIRILKGEPRFGTWVEFSVGDREIQSWKWRHWGCITPTVIQNLLNSLGGLDAIERDPNIIDGYDEMPQEWQEKILTMLREGHVPDEDWKGDVEQNRPGKRGSHKKSKSAKKKVGDDENEEDDAEGTPSKAKAAKGRGKKAKAETNDDEDGLRSGGSPPKKRKKRPIAGDEEEDDLTEAPSMPRKSGHLALVEAGKEDEAPEEKPTKKSRGKKIKVEERAEGQVTEPKNNGLDGRTSRVARNARRKKADHLKLEEKEAGSTLDEQAAQAEQVDGPAEVKVQAEPKETKPTGRKGRAKRSVKVEDAHQEEQADNPAEEGEIAADVEDETKPKAKTGRKKGVAKPIARGRQKPKY